MISQHSPGFGQPSAEAATSAEQPAQPRWHWLQRAVPSIRHKIILPYLMLTAAVAMMGIFIVTRLIANTIDERLTNQLLEAGRVASDGIVRHESRLLEVLRPMTQTIGVEQAIRAGDVDRLRELLEVQAYNGNLDSLLVLDGAGDLLVRLDAVRAFNLEVIDDYQFSSGGNYANLPIVAPILAGYIDERGDKYAGLVDTPAGPILYSSAPVVHTINVEGQTETVGVILAGISLERLLIHLKSESLADIVAYVEPGKPIGSTVPDWQQEAQYQTLTISPEIYDEAISTPGTTPLSEIEALTLFEREYRMAYAPMTVRGRPIGVLSVLLPSNFVVRAISTSRWSFIVIFSLAMGLVAVVGYLVAQRILRPVYELAALARAITSGDLTQRAKLITNDELGVLARTFNDMVTRLQLSLADLEEENARTKAILGSIADAVIVRDPDGKIILTNPAAQEMLTTQDTVDLAPVHSIDVQKEGTISPRIAVGQHTISVSAAPVETPDGSMIGEVLVLRDVTREAMVERTKDNFLNYIGHELRTPLTAIQGYAEILGRSGDQLDSEIFWRAVDTIYRQALILAQMIDQMIDLTAIRSGDITLQRQSFNLHALVTERLEVWSEQFAVTGLVPHFESEARDLTIEGDPRRLQRAIDALLKNACQFSPEGGELAVRLMHLGDRLCLSVSDPGVGISEEDRPHVFERFFRGSPTDRDGNPIDVRGVGQGLHMVKSIVEAHGGAVELYSKVGEGTTVRVYLPLTAKG
jgi:signal transduction histidine kinase